MYFFFLVAVIMNNDSWNNFSSTQIYEASRPQYEELVIPAIFKYCKTNRVTLAADLACGTGQLARHLSTRCDRVLGLDVSLEQINTARNNSSASNVSFHQCSVFETHKMLEGLGALPVDLITVGVASHYFHGPQFYAEVRRCLRKGGTLAEVCYWIRGLENCAESLSNKCIQFVNALFRDCQKNHGVEHNMQRYQGFDVRMDNVERLDMIMRVEWTYSKLARYFTFSSPWVAKRQEEIDTFFQELEKEDGKMSVTVAFDIFGFFSQNLSDD